MNIFHKSAVENLGDFDKIANALGIPKMTKSERSVYFELFQDVDAIEKYGCPDFVTITNGKLKFVEVKHGGDKLTSVQERYIAILEEGGVEVSIVCDGIEYSLKEWKEKNGNS